MKYIIPDDWDGVTWRCVSVDFPDSDQFTWLLLGWLSDLKRGRVWDGSTGTITDIQAIMWDMWERNKSLRPCGSECDDQPIIQYASCSDSSENCEESDMSCNCPEPPIKIEDGILYYWHCCQWMEIGALPGAAAAEVVEPFGDQTPAPTYSACSKAKAIIDVIYLVADTVWENQLSAPWSWVGLVEDAVVGHNDLDDNQIISAFGAAIVINTLYDYADVFDPLDKQALLCGVAQLLDATSAGITREQWDQMIGLINTNYGEGVDDFFRACAEAVGPADMREITALSSVEAGYDCSCPYYVENPTGSWSTDWAHFWAFTGSGMPAGATLGPNTLQYPGIGLMDLCDDGNGYQKPDVRLPFVTEAGVITRVWFAFKMVSGTTYDSAEFLAGTDQDPLAGQAQVTDTDPSSGGVFVVDRLVSVSIGSADNQVTWVIEGHAPSPYTPAADMSTVLLACAIGGTGTDPFIA